MAWSTLYSIKKIFIYTKRKEAWLSYRGNVISEGQLVINHDDQVSCNLSGSKTRVSIVMQMLWCMAWLGGPARFNWGWCSFIQADSEERLRLRREVVRVRRQVVQHLLCSSDISNHASGGLDPVRWYAWQRDGSWACLNGDEMCSLIIYVCHYDGGWLE